jgi:hypothetical protein
MIPYSFNGEVHYLSIDELQAVEASGRSSREDYMLNADSQPKRESLASTLVWMDCNPKIEVDVKSFVQIKAPIPNAMKSPLTNLPVCYHLEGASCIHSRRAKVKDAILDVDGFLSAVETGKKYCGCCWNNYNHDQWQHGEKKFHGERR